MPAVGERVVRRAAAKPGAADDSEGAAWPYGFDGDAFLRSAPELYNDWKDPGFLAAHDPKQNEHRDFVILGAAGSGPASLRLAASLSEPQRIDGLRCARCSPHRVHP